MSKMKIVSFALNWSVYKASENVFWVGTEDRFVKKFSKRDQAIAYMLDQVYG